MTTLRTERADELRRFEFRANKGDGKHIEGYAAVFNDWTDIRDHMGTYRERILPGAFKRTISQRTPVVQFDHGQHPLIGSLPITAPPVLREDKNGLFIRGRLIDNWLVQPVRDAIDAEAIDGMSIRMRVVSDDWGTDNEGRETRTIHEVELLELGPVVFPAYVNTSVAVRSLMGALDDETRAELARELTAPADEAERDEDSTSTVAVEPANQDDSPDEPPVASHEDNRNRIAEALARYRHQTERTPDVDQ